MFWYVPCLYTHTHTCCVCVHLFTVSVVLYRKRRRDTLETEREGERVAEPGGRWGQRSGVTPGLGRPGQNIRRRKMERYAYIHVWCPRLYLYIYMYM